MKTKSLRWRVLVAMPGSTAIWLPRLQLRPACASATAFCLVSAS